MKIAVLCEGRTEHVLRTALRRLVQDRSSGPAVGIETRNLGGPVVTDRLPRFVKRLVVQQDVLGVIALTDVYPDFHSAEEAKQRLQTLVEDAGHRDKFHAHVAKFEVEAWLMPFWSEIAAKLGVSAKPPGARPEDINDQKPPSRHLRELFGRARRNYDKVRYAAEFLTADRLEQAAKACPELKAFLNCLLELADADPIT